MDERIKEENRTLLAFWDKAFALPEEDGEDWDADVWRELAPSEKLLQAACALGKRKRVLDYGCGNGWAAIAAAKSGCADVIAVDAAPGAAETARTCAARCGTQALRIECVAPDWLGTVSSGSFDGFICSNVLDVVPEETAEELLREAARIVTADAEVYVGLNYHISPEAAAKRGMELVDGRRLYVDGVLRLVSRTDEEWAAVFAPFFTVESLDHFAWPGEAAETRRLFRLKKNG